MADSTLKKKVILTSKYISEGLTQVNTYFDKLVANMKYVNKTTVKAVVDTSELNKTDLGKTKSGLLQKPSAKKGSVPNRGLFDSLVGDVENRKTKGIFRSKTNVFKPTGATSPGGLATSMMTNISPMLTIGVAAVVAIAAILIKSSKMLQRTLGNIMKFVLMLIRPIGDMLAVLLYPLMMLIRPLSLMMNTLIRPYLQAARKSFRAGLQFYAQARRGQTTELKTALTKWGDMSMFNGLSLIGVGFIKLLIKSIGESLKIQVGLLVAIMKFQLLAIKGIGDLFLIGIRAVLNIFGGGGLLDGIQDLWNSVFYSSIKNDEGVEVPTGIITVIDWFGANASTVIDMGVTAAMAALDTLGDELIQQSENYSTLAGEVTASLSAINNAPIPNDLKINLERVLADLLSTNNLDKAILNVKAFNAGVIAAVKELKIDIEKDLNFEFDFPDYAKFFTTLSTKFEEVGGIMEGVLDNLIKKYRPESETLKTFRGAQEKMSQNMFGKSVGELSIPEIMELTSAMGELARGTGDITPVLDDLNTGMSLSSANLNILSDDFINASLQTQALDLESLTLANMYKDTHYPAVNNDSSALVVHTAALETLTKEANAKVEFIKNWSPPTQESNNPDESLASGGSIDQNGTYYLHRGETVVNPVDSSFSNTAGGGSGGDIIVNMNNSTFGDFSQWKAQMDDYFSQQMRHMR